MSLVVKPFARGTEKAVWLGSPSSHFEPGSRMFLVKQGHHSIVCQLDLKGFNAELAAMLATLAPRAQ